MFHYLQEDFYIFDTYNTLTCAHTDRSFVLQVKNEFEKVIFDVLSK